MIKPKFPGLDGVILLLPFITTTACSSNAPDRQISPSPTSPTTPTATTEPTDTLTAVPDTPIPSTPTPSPIPSPTPEKVTEPEDIVGLWHGEGRDGMYFKFAQDGTCQQTIVRDTLDKNPNVTCEYHFEGDQFVLTTLMVERLPPCPQHVVVYEIHRQDNGNIKFVNVNDRCQPRVRSTAVEHVPIE